MRRLGALAVPARPKSSELALPESAMNREATAEARQGKVGARLHWFYHLFQRRTMLNNSSRRFALVGSGIALSALCAAVALAATVDCAGGGPRCEGTNEPDTIYGSDNKDEIFAKGAPDNVYGFSADDISHGGGGDDLLSETSGGGKDTMFGDGGSDDMQSGLLGDELYGGDDGELFMNGEEGSDLVAGQDGADIMRGEEGDDTLLGGRGNDSINAAVNESEGGRDTVDCGKGSNDSATVNPNDDVTRCDGNVTVEV
jgi:Ca2+-binding RTX toxin-like protein